jgi:hypothetical protein
VGYEESDADVLSLVARRLFEESREMFRAAHRKGKESFDAPTTEEHLRLFGEAVADDRLAFEMQCAAVELQREAYDLRAKGRAKLKAAQGG